MVDGADANTIKAAENARYSASIQGNQMYYANMAPGGGGGVGRMSLDELSRPTRVENMSELVRNLPATDQQNLQNAFQNVNLSEATMDQFAKQFNRPMTVDQAEHVRENVASYAAAPAFSADPNTWDNAQRIQIGNLVVGQSLGVPAPAGAQEHVIRYALESAKSPDVQERAIAVNAIGSVDAKALETDSDLQQSVANALEGRINDLSDAFKAASNNPEMLKKIEQVVRTVAKAGQDATQKATEGSISDLQKQMANLNEQIRADKSLNKVVNRKKDKS
jgi:hypothetical protein